MSYTISPGLTTQIAVSGNAVTVVPASPNGGIITNPYAATDQGLVTAEVLYVSPIGSATLQGNNTTFALQPGQSWQVIPGQTTPTTVNSATGGHQFSAIWW